MSENISISEAAGWLEERDNYLILTHIRPDGDTLGCAIALVRGLRELGKTAYMMDNPQITGRFADYVDGCQAPDGFTPSFVVAVDTATQDLIPKNASTYLDDIALCIDHHDSNTNYARLVCCHREYAACGEIICEILVSLFAKAGISMSKTIADCLYIAISTDTGCFSYGNTTANTHKVAAYLIGQGAASKEINKLFFRSKRRERIKIDGMIISGIEFYFGGKVAIAVITREMMESSGANEDDIDDISNVASSIEGVCIGITIREMTSPTDCKISVRTMHPYSASELCKKLGGGGHKAAAGAHIAKTIDETRNTLLEILESYDFS